ncbi:MAG: Trk system potassium transporter TrkA, partial [Alphaproteobacteria bacterium]|nr:Trk system potassium transporter TrkA [Alphaproteobacteria bacterium]
MRVIVCGAGQVGVNIARYLAAEHNDVTVVDQSSELIEQLAETLDIRAVAGHASSPDVLARAGAEDADMLIAVTLVDEINMIACQVAHSLFNIPTKIARIRRPSYLDGHWADMFAREGMPIDTIISPEREVASAIMRRLSRPGATEMLPFADGRVRLIGVRLEDTCPIVNTPLRQLTALFPDLNINVVGIVRAERNFVPKARDQMLVGDEVYFVVDNAHVARA